MTAIHVPAAAAHCVPPGRERHGPRGYVNRIRESGRAIGQLIESRRTTRRRVRPPRFAFDFVIDESTKIITGAPFDETSTDARSGPTSRAKVADFRRRAPSTPRGQGPAGRRPGGADGTVPHGYRNLIAWQKEDRQSAGEDVGRRGAAERRGVLP